MSEELQQKLRDQLWEVANRLRGNMSASDFMYFTLGFIFYKYLSEKIEKYANNALADDEVTFKELWETDDADAIELQEEAKNQCLENIGYFIEPKFLFSSVIEAIKRKENILPMLERSLKRIEDSTLGQDSEDDFGGLFSDIDLASPKLGKTADDKNTLVSNVLLALDDIDFGLEASQEIDILGDAYEYMISQFAAGAGKKAGEFYTPQAVSKILTKIAISGQEDKKGLSVYDPCMGSGSLLLNAKKYASAPEYIKYYGQEQNTSTYNLARMNMFLHGIVAENQHLRNGDTLDGDWPTGEETDFNMVLMNPPYSAKWSAAAGFLQDERFSDYGVLAPKSKADYAFLLHGLYHLKNNGTMAIVLPHGVLFRGAAEGKIREKLLRSGNIYAVIGLPANLFYNTSIPTCIIVLKKHRDGRDVLFIDASKKFNKGKKQNEMTDEHIDEVLALYSDRKTVEKESYLASFEDIEKNDFNLNIPRYVDNFEKEEDVDINTLLQDMKKTDDELEQVKGDFVSLLKDLTSPDQNIIFSLNDLIRKLEG